MPEILPLGWFHTAVGILALVTGVFTLIRYKEISPQNRSGRLYLGATLIAAGTALAIYQHGGFGVAHALAVLTIVVLVVGMLAAMTGLFGKLSRYVQATAFSTTLFFHCVPAVTDALLRLPVGNPMVTSLDDPLMKTSHLVLFIMLLVGLGIQLRWIRRQSAQID